MSNPTRTTESNSRNFKKVCFAVIEKIISWTQELRFLSLNDILLHTKISYWVTTFVRSKLLNKLELVAKCGSNFSVLD